MPADLATFWSLTVIPCSAASDWIQTVSSRSPIAASLMSEYCLLLGFGTVCKPDRAAVCFRARSNCSLVIGEVPAAASSTTAIESEGTLGAPETPWATAKPTNRATRRTPKISTPRRRARSRAEAGALA